MHNSEVDHHYNYTKQRHHIHNKRQIQEHVIISPHEICEASNSRAGNNSLSQWSFWLE